MTDQKANGDGGDSRISATVRWFGSWWFRKQRKKAHRKTGRERVAAAGREKLGLGVDKEKEKGSGICLEEGK